MQQEADTRVSKSVQLHQRHIPNQRDIANLHVQDKLLLSSSLAPESITFDTDGKGPYTGISNGHILKWRGCSLGWQEFATTSNIRTSNYDSIKYFHVSLESKYGRPLGLQFNKGTGDLYITDAYFGLLTIGLEGGKVAQVAVTTMAVDDQPFGLTNGLDVDQQNDMVYFTDNSTHFQRREQIH
ncbi:protein STRICTOSIDINE SYNTHASE-LIKE 10-like [Dioscorea cayenensis subsp. rotundata]|uniref:Protein STRICTOSIDINE SYNTHASE-LIKE 10-like n=1 Tax=Dioscorea cayennensis subsp. rotundata TaxID=55577 RepID=A0AB40AW81_DIOCR|nr:protein STRICTOSIDINE SYNTHASE-LIKE 10-like [Dioscorea cayenensis subsp. rotundata]XP_039119383.1 protein STRICTOSIDINE SYNTHASE-LIKE 10-like [Dioscorea cayenensis subsp. rotundata]XP_039119384.1 protein STRICTOSIDINE SYNTHASE-LIKE 10-like [Dioscorea cayenensis subsp. rotundata]XP_039119385.1 protein STRICTOSIDINE SYNTHASE-LIKE 10-like [Dioscorea cayenensis subsp. rotundata]XP_039119386.1 protein STRICTOSIDINE SYNTHASE-LIKE 10-like [Dioscorea cayenensis subsp. rotundata]